MTSSNPVAASNGQNPTLPLRRVALAELRQDPRNARSHDRRNLDAIKESLQRFGQVLPIVVRQGQIVGGNATTIAADELGWTHLDATPADHLTAEEAVALAIALNRTAELASWDASALVDALAGLPTLEGTGFTAEELAELEGLLGNGSGGGDGSLEQEAAALSLAERFVVPPFSVLDARQGYWQDRKRAWLGLGIASEQGRDGAVFNKSEGSDPTSEKIRAPGAQSVFDPVLCELVYRWFSPAGGMILDPFAGGSVRGIVAAWLGHPYIGIDLSGEQVGVNREQAERVLRDGQRWPEWREGDSRQVLPDVADESADLLFTCPPYYDLEVYSDDPRDLSRSTDYEAFLDGYAKILHGAARCLRPNRFVVLVVGEVRASDGIYHGLIPDTIAAMEQASCRYYNEAVLVTAPVTVGLRAAMPFQASRKLGKTHQNVLVFYKGDPKAIRDTYGEVEVGDAPAATG